MKLPRFNLRLSFRARLTASAVVAAVLIGTLWLGWHEFSRTRPSLRELELDWKYSDTERHENDQERFRLKRDRWNKNDWQHEDYAFFGSYGGREDAIRLIRGLKRGMTDLDRCGTGDRPAHLSTGLAIMTNHALGSNSDAWIDWLAANERKSQSEWILDGFKEVGLTLEVPPTREQAWEVFRRVGHSAEYTRSQNQSGAPQKMKKPDPVRDGLESHQAHNAFRLLRDCKFEVKPMMAGELSGPEVAFMVNGALDYTTFLVRGRGSRLGHVFDDPARDTIVAGRPPALQVQKWLQWIWLGGSLLVALGLAAALRRLWRLRGD